MTNALTLSHGDYTARVLPAVGGSLARLQWRGRNLVQAYPQELEDTPDHVQLGCFPMLPYAGRVRDARFGWRGAEIEVARHTPEPHGLHGEGWVAQWDVALAEESQCSLTMQHREGALQFDARMDYCLKEDGLSLVTSITSRAAIALPFGIGQHPWFPREEGAQLQLSAKRFWLEAPGGFPSQSITIPPELDHARGNDLPLAWRNNCYEGWDGKAVITYPGSGHTVTLTASETLGWLMVYANPDCDCVCLEPQSHLPAAHNTGSDDEHFGLVELAPGETLTGTMGISAAPL